MSWFYWGTSIISSTGFEDDEDATCARVQLNNNNTLELLIGHPIVKIPPNQINVVEVVGGGGNVCRRRHLTLSSSDDTRTRNQYGGTEFQFRVQSFRAWYDTGSGLHCGVGCKVSHLLEF